jgi:hypothetical protein
LATAPPLVLLPSLPFMGSKTITQIEVIMRTKETPPPLPPPSAQSSNQPVKLVPPSSYMSQPQQMPQMYPILNNGLSGSPPGGAQLAFYPTPFQPVATISSIVLRNVKSP